MDDMLVKRRKENQHVAELTKVFNILNAYGMKLNPVKCALAVVSGKLMGFMVSQTGIEVYP